MKEMLLSLYTREYTCELRGRRTHILDFHIEAAAAAAIALPLEGTT